jgi:hypothetical protein
MQIDTRETNGRKFARITSRNTLFCDVDEALDLMATVRHTTGSNCMLVDASAIAPRFFELRSGLAGEILQKFSTYMMKLAIIGDFSQYTSKSLHDFIYESNKGNHILFVSNEEEAVAKFS